MASTRNVHNEQDREAWIGIQRKTFSRWANQYLPADSKIENLVADLADGLVLSRLLAKISGETVGRVNKNPRMDIQKLENLNQCLDFIKQHDIPLVNIGSSDILKGNEKLVLGLLWTIILRFEVAGADGKAGLLLWLQRSTKGYAGVEVKDFTSSWKDGLAFQALIHRYRPDLVQNFDSLQAVEALSNCDSAFAIAEEHLGIARLLDPEDVVNSPDEKSQVAYLSQFFKLFASQAKLDSKLKAVKNAVEVTRRHDEWSAQYEAVSEKVLQEAQSKCGWLEKEEALSTTAQVKEALDAFDQYMKETKPALAAQRAEAEGIHTTLVSSKRNNNRPEFVPQVSLEEIVRAWDQLEQDEQGYERKMLDKFLAFQMADHAVSKFNAKSATVSAWLDEKVALFTAAETGSSVPEVEANLEVHTAFENRYALHATVLDDLRALSTKAGAVEGHAGGQKVLQEMEQLATRMEEVKAAGQAHREKLEAALEAEKTLQDKVKDYLRRVDNLDFQADKLEETVKTSDEGATAAEMRDVEDSKATFDQEVDAAERETESLHQLAEEIATKKPDAAEHCKQQKDRLASIRSAMEERCAKLSALRAEEQKREELSKQFADLASAFNEFCDAKHNALGSLTGSLEEQKESLGKLREEVVGEGGSGTQQLAALNSASEACDEANIVANRHTTHTIYSLRSEHEQLVKAVKRSEEAVQAQLMAQKSLEIPPERLREIQETFNVFDVDGDGKLKLSEVKEACLGAGIDLEDDELEARMRARKPDMIFTLDDFIAFFLAEIQSGDSKEDVVAALETVAGGSANIEADKLRSNFAPLSQDLAEYLVANMAGGDYRAFADQIFSR